MTLGVGRSVHLSCRSKKVRNIASKPSQSTLPGGTLLRSAAHHHRQGGARAGGGGGGGGGCGGGGGGGGGECCRVGEVVQHVGHLVLVWLLALVGGRGVGVGGGGVGGVPGGVGGFRWIGLEDWVVVGVAVCWLILGVGVGGRVDGLAGGVGDRRRLGVGVGGESVPVAVTCQPTRHRQNNNFTSPCWASESAAGAASVQWRQERRRTASWWRWRVMLVAASSPAN